MAAHYCICKYCNTKFNRDAEAYAKVSSNRYAHAACALRYQTAHPDEPAAAIIDPSNFVTCIYCKKILDKSKEEFKLFSNGKYAHKQCYELEQKRELTDQEKLEKYIMELYNVDYVNPRIRKQIKDYVENYGYTYSGIQKALTYWYEIKGHIVDPKYIGTIAIVTSVYDQAYRYYYAIWEAQQKQEIAINSGELEKYIPKQVIIKIPVPKREEKKRKLFSFLDEKEDN